MRTTYTMPDYTRRWTYFALRYFWPVNLLNFVLEQQILLVQKNFCIQKIFGPKFLCPKLYFVKKICGLKIVLGPKKFLCTKRFWGHKILVQKNFGKKKLGAFNLNFGGVVSLHSKS